MKYTENGDRLTNTRLIPSPDSTLRSKTALVS